MERNTMNWKLIRQRNDSRWNQSIDRIVTFKVILIRWALIVELLLNDWLVYCNVHWIIQLKSVHSHKHTHTHTLARGNSHVHLYWSRKQTDVSTSFAWLWIDLTQIWLRIKCKHAHRDMHTDTLTIRSTHIRHKQIWLNTRANTTNTFAVMNIDFGFSQNG